jgi:hypothetical protein
LETPYIEKTGGSDQSSKYSDKSDSRKSSLERKREKSSSMEIKRENRYNNDKDDRSSSSGSIDITEWKISKKLMQDWNMAESPNNKDKKIASKSVEIITKPKKELSNKNGSDTRSSDLSSIFMNVNEINQMKQITTFPRKHANGVNDFDPSIPDAGKWTCDDVVDYFSSSFPEYADLFKEQVY